MTDRDASTDLSDVSALLAAYAAMTPAQRQALLGLAQAMAPRRTRSALSDRLPWLEPPSDEA